MPDRSIDVLRHAAAAGDLLAMTRLGERLLVDAATVEPVEAADVLDRAVRGGGVEAPALLAMLFAIGAGRPQNWTAALDLLEVGAVRGSRSAQGQLAVLADLAADDPRAGRAAPWSQLRGAINPATWRRPGPQDAPSRSPRIYVYPSFISPAVCAWAIGRAKGRVTPARVYDPEAPGLKVESVRTNSAFEFSLVDMDVVMAMLRHRIAAVVGVAEVALEPPQILHYHPGQKFERHYDFLDPALPGHAPDIAAHGQRIVTCLIYLNDGFEGGETEFPLLDQRHRPTAGGALCFVNVQPTGAPDRRTLHAGLPPTSGEKWLLSQWIRDRKGR